MAMQTIESFGRERANDATSVESDTNIQSRAEHVRSAVWNVANEYREKGVLSSEDVSSLTAGLENVYKGGSDLKNWEIFVRRGLPGQMQEYERLLSTFHGKMEDAKNVISQQSFDDWHERFRNATIAQKKYFLDSQFPEFIRNWQLISEKRDTLLAQAKKELTASDVPMLTDFTSEAKFKELSYREKADLLGRVEAALNTHGDVNIQALYMEAKQKLESRAGLSLGKNKVGVWLQRIFSKGHNKEAIRTFVQGSGSDSLKGLMDKWDAVASKFATVKRQMETSPSMGVKNQIISLDAFLAMHYDQRTTYVREAERTLLTSQNIKKEHPQLLRIRHYLDIKDWEEAELAITEAQKMSFDLPEDISRLKSMREYLSAHRTDGKKTGVTIPPENAEILAAAARIDESMVALHPGMAKIANTCLMYGNQAVANFRWGIRNYEWCEDNGYLDNNKAQKGLNANKKTAVQKVKQGQDPGMHDPVLYADEELIRKDEYSKNTKVRATMQYVNIEDPGTCEKIAEWYKDRDPQVLYWTTFIGCTGSGQTLGSSWHKTQLKALNEIRSATRTIEQAGLRYFGRGAWGFSSALGSKFSVN